MHRHDEARRRVGLALGEKRVFESTGSHERIRLLTGVGADESYATNPIAWPRRRPPNHDLDRRERRCVLATTTRAGT
jgi:hypothetical protein